MVSYNKVNQNVPSSNIITKKINPLKIENTFHPLTIPHPATNTFSNGCKQI